MENQTPTLDELFDEYRMLINDEKTTNCQEAFLRLMHGVASGSITKYLSDESAQFAAQTVLVIYYHVKKEMES